MVLILQPATQILSYSISLGLSHIKYPSRQSSFSPPLKDSWSRVHSCPFLTFQFVPAWTQTIHPGQLSPSSTMKLPLTLHPLPSSKLQQHVLSVPPARHFDTCPTTLLAMSKGKKKLYYILVARRPSTHSLFSSCHCFKGMAKQILLALRFKIVLWHLERNGILKERCFWFARNWSFEREKVC